MNPEAALADALAEARNRIAPFGCRVHFLPETDSTNDVAAALAEGGAPEGTVVIAGSQTQGRGRMGREWYSPADAGLYVSLICRNPAAAPLLTLAGAVAVAEGIRSATGLAVEIKWPNDIVVPAGGAASRWRKIAGILAEASSGPDGLHHVVLGIGVNVRGARYPQVIADRATSIETELGRAVDAAVLLVEILAAFATVFAALTSGRAAAVLDRWRALAPSASGARVECETARGRCVGTTAGVADDGALLVRTAAGTERIVAGEVVWR